jgi:hypothetical protein
MSYTVTPLTGHTGAEVRGIKLANDVDHAARADLNRAFASHHVLVIRDQELTPEGFKKAAQVFGELQQHDKKETHVPGHPDVYYVSNDQIVNGPHGPFESSGATEGDDTVRCVTAQQRRRYAVRQHARRLRRFAGGDEAADRRDESGACLPQQVQPSVAGAIDGGKPEGAATAGHPSFGARPSGQRPQGAVSESGAH